MRIRFRASDFGLVAKIKLSRAKSKQTSRAEIMFGSFFFCSCDSAVRFLDSENSSQRRLLLRPAPRRAHFARPWTRASKPTLTDSSLAAKQTCPGASRGIFFNKASEPSTRAAALCVLSHDTYSHERRALGALLSLFSRPEPASANS